MISEWGYGIFSGIVVWFLGLVPAFPTASAQAGIASILAPMSSALGGLGGWIPWDQLAVIVPISVGLYVAGLILRIVKSLLPTISG